MMGAPPSNDDNPYGFGGQMGGPPPISAQPESNGSGFDIYGGMGSNNAEGYGSGFATGVMGGGGGGGFDLPSPNQLPGGDAYANPFGS